MIIYDLGQDEVVIMQDAHVTDAASGSVTLVLTNENIIQVNKGFWGNDKSYEKYPLLKLKEYNGKPNVLVGKAPNGTARLELYFSSFEKYYTFQSTFAERKWANAIAKAYKACVVDAKKVERAKADKGAIFAPILNTFDSAKNAIKPKPKAPKVITVKCPRCGAELKGEKGSEVTCSYCDAVVPIK